MKKVILLFGMFTLFNQIILSQELNMSAFIGNSINQVISRMGKPVYQDDSNPVMICTFYKTSTTRHVFVSNNKGVFQAEACVSFTNESSIEKSVSKLISECTSEGFTSDTLSTESYCVQNVKVKVEISTSKNSLTNKFDLRIKATRKE